MSDHELVLFDLDGTLIDTAPDMAAALNELLESEGRPALPFATLRPHVSHGSIGMLRVGFGDDLSADELERLRTAFLGRYQANLAIHSRPFAGIESLLDTIDAAGLRWGVVTNKPCWLTEPLLRVLGLDQRAAVIVSGDTLERCKPDPAPLLFACTTAGIPPASAVYVGDAERDVAAGRAAGMDTVVALYGYLGADDRPESWGATAHIDAPGDLRAHLGDRISPAEAP